MVFFHHIPSIFVSFFVIQTASCAVLERFFNGATSCETGCETFFGNALEQRKSCSEGCRLYTVIGLAKDIRDVNKTTELCIAACSEAFANESETNACNYGCSAYPPTTTTEEIEEVQTLHLLTPLMYVKSAYNSMTHHMRQLISTSWTVYVQADDGKMVVLQSSPKVIENYEFSVSKEDDNSGRDYQSSWQDTRGDWMDGWMDCISHQSGIPRWLLVMMLFGVIFGLLWICCATAVTAPNQHVSSKKKSMGYIVVCDTNKEIKVPLIPKAEPDEEAPPLPPKISLI